MHRAQSPTPSLQPRVFPCSPSVCPSTKAVPRSELFHAVSSRLIYLRDLIRSQLEVSFPLFRGCYPPGDSPSLFLDDLFLKKNNNKKTPHILLFPGTILSLSSLFVESFNIYWPEPCPQILLLSPR